MTSTCPAGEALRGGRFIGLDVGTTNARAWLVAGGRIVVSRRAGVGIRDAAAAGSPEVLHEPLRRLIADVRAAGEGTAPPRAVVAAGMITSNLGLCEVRHVDAPAAPADLVRGAACLRDHPVSDLPIFLVPGVRSGAPRLPPERISEADVMRGEETLCVGLLERGLLTPGGTVLNLGSHWKTISVDTAGCVSGSTTTLAGELLHAAQTRTVLAGSVPEGRPARLDADWADAGVTEAARSGLERALFCVRLLEQRAEGSAEQRLSFLIGCFLAGALDGWLRNVPTGEEVVVTGGGPIGEFAARRLTRAGRRARNLSADGVEAAMVAGLHVVASSLLADL